MKSSPDDSPNPAGIAVPHAVDNARAGATVVVNGMPSTLVQVVVVASDTIPVSEARTRSPPV